MLSSLAKEHLDEAVCRNRGRPRDADVRKRILESALEMLEEFGFANTTADGIAQRAGASKATLYRWWPNKGAVLSEALRHAIAQELPFPNTGNLYDDIRLHLRKLVELLSGRNGRILTALLAAQSDPEAAETFQAVWRGPRTTAAKIALARDSSSALREHANVDVVLDALYGPLYYRLLTGGEAVTAAYADALADILVEGILKR